MMGSAAHTHEPWRERIYLPNYKVSEAAHYAGISPGTVASWHALREGRPVTLSEKESGRPLSYMQLIEVAVVAVFRKNGVTLKKIRDARKYIGGQLDSQYPFAQYRFKTDGKELWMDYVQFERKNAEGKLLKASGKGQLAWSEIIGRLKEFDYEDDGIVIRWSVAGKSKPIVIDPRISFGAPTVRGTPTWLIKGRWMAGETMEEIVEDFGLTNNMVRSALEFESVDPNSDARTACLH